MRPLAVLGRCLLTPCLFTVIVPTVSDAHNCRCRNRGVMFELGETSCLQVDGRSYLARCEMKLNVPSWSEIQDGCPVTTGPTLLPARTIN